MKQYENAGKSDYRKEGMNLKKATIIFFLFALLLITSLCLAEETKPIVLESGDYQYTILENNTAEITKYAPSDETTLVKA